MLSESGLIDKKLVKEKIEEKLLTTIWRPGCRPLNKSELARALEVESKDRAILREVLMDLERSGIIPTIFSRLPGHCSKPSGRLTLRRCATMRTTRLVLHAGGEQQGLSWE